MWYKVCKEQTKISLKYHYQVCEVITERELEADAQPSHTRLGRSTRSGVSLCCPLVSTSLVANHWVWSKQQIVTCVR